MVAGEDVKYNTHQYTDNAHQKALSDSQLRSRIQEDVRARDASLYTVVTVDRKVG